MSDRSQLIALPARIHAFLADGIERHGSGGGAIPDEWSRPYRSHFRQAGLSAWFPVGRSAGSSILALMIDGRVALEGLDKRPHEWL
jgi:hypothetical protein